MGTNDFVPFCNENTGTNLPTQSAYLANPDLPIGNQPGIASSSLNNKALRQGTTIAAVLSQFVVDQLSVDMLDDQNSADHSIPGALYGATALALKRLSPTIIMYTTGSGIHYLTYKFQTASANATSGDTYTDGTTTFTVSKTISSGTELWATGPAAPISSGVLSKVSGSGDATITFYAVRAPLYGRLRMAGGGAGGGGGSSGTGGGTGGAGGDSTFGGNTAGGAAASASFSIAGAGGSVTLAAGFTGIAVQGGIATDGGTNYGAGGAGASTSLGGAGGAGYMGTKPGSAAVANTGSGGGGGGGASNNNSGCGGSAGGYIDAICTTLSASYVYAVGGGGTAGAAGGTASAGGSGGSGVIIFEEHYQ